jgi:uncharacterized protein YjiS (DUF1127 family)
MSITATVFLFAREGGSMGARVAGLAGRTGHALRIWLRTLVTRQGLSDIDDRMLADLGISRAQADFELSRAPWTLTRPH